jgi:hypothetical protein
MEQIGLIISICSGVLVIISLVTFFLKPYQWAKKQQERIDGMERGFNSHIGPNYDPQKYEDKFDAFVDSFEGHCRQTKILLNRDYNSICKLQERQIIIRQGIVALMESIEESEVMNNKAAIAEAKKKLFHDLLEH